MKRNLKAKGGGGGSARPDTGDEQTGDGTGGSKTSYAYVKTYGIANFKRTYNYDGTEN